LVVYVLYFVDFLIFFRHIWWFSKLGMMLYFICYSLLYLPELRTYTWWSTSFMLDWLYAP